jgi:hypothetical protein
MGEDGVAEKTVKILRSISRTINEKEQQQSVSRINFYLKVIGNAAIEKKFLRTPQEAIKSIYEIGKESIKINSEVSEQSTLLLGDLARNGIKYNHGESTYKAIHSIRSLGQLGVKEGLDRIARKSLWSLELIGKTQGIYRHIRRHEKWIQNIQEWEGETYEETTIDEGFEEEMSLFDQTLLCAYTIGRFSIEMNRDDVSVTAIDTLKRIGEMAIEKKFDNKEVPRFLGNLGGYASRKSDEKIALSSIEALETISLNVDKDLRNSFKEIARSLIRIGTVALREKLDKIALSAAQNLTNMSGKDERTIAIVKTLLDESVEGIQDFKKMYLKIQVK